MSDLMDLAKRAVDLAKKHGADEVAVAAGSSRDVEVQWRDGRIDKISEATTRDLRLRLYVGQRYSATATSDLRPDAVDRFVGDAVALTRALVQDPFRSLPNPALYQGQATVDLGLVDQHYGSISPADRRRLAAEVEQAARSVKRAEAILSVTSWCADSHSEVARVVSNGFEGEWHGTRFSLAVEVSVKDADGRRPSDTAEAVRRHIAELPTPAEVGKLATERALGRLGSKKVASEVLPMVVEARAARRLVGMLLDPLGGQALQQKRSFYEGKAGKPVAAKIFTLIDDPLVPKDLGSRLFDAECIAAKKLPIIEAGVLKAYYVDDYYGRKLKMAPTTGSVSNLTFKTGKRGLDELIAEAHQGIVVTAFLGGNSNSTTGDFSVGVQGFRIVNGKRGEPIAEMNIAANHLQFWNKLVAVGNDPYSYSAIHAPSLMFEQVQFAGI